MEIKLCKVKCENNSLELFVEAGTTLLEILKMVNINNDLPFIAAYVNNVSKDLNYRIYENKQVLFIDTSHSEGYKVYERTLSFILVKASRELYPECQLKIKYSISDGSYFELDGINVSEEVVQALSSKMRELITADIPILRDKINYIEAEEIYAEQGMDDKRKLLHSNPHLYVTINKLSDLNSYFYGTLAPSTGYISLFEIQSFYDGFYLITPSRCNPMKMSPFINNSKIFDVMCRHKRLLEVLDVADVGSLNELINSGKSGELIRVGEVIQENNFSFLAHQVNNKCAEGVKVVLISGPSSSGKTTFSSRLMIQLLVFGYKPIIISMDNYFVNRVDSPMDEEGNYDFDTINALDIDLFNSNIKNLVNGETVEIPYYNFTTGEREWRGTNIALGERNILLVEGIHVLNPLLADSVADNKKYKIYVSALTTISLDDHTRMSTTDNRLIRRIVRDAAYRNHSAEQTLKRWASVRRGEQKYIFPYQDNADYLFNTSLFFEFSVLKKYIIPLLFAVPDTALEYSEARRLLELLDNFVTIDADMIPPTSIIREFIGGSSFEY